MKRLRKFAKVAGLVAIVLAIVTAGLAWRDRAARDAMIAPIREAGDPVSIADLRPSDVDSDDNAVTFLVRVASELQQVVNEVYPVAMSDGFDWATGLTDDQQQKTEDILAAHPEVKNAVERASQCRSLQWPLEHSAKPSVFSEALLHFSQSMRSVARYHVAMTRQLAASGDADAAANACVQGLQIVRLQDSTPTIMASMVNTACRVSLVDNLGGLIKHHQLKPETHQAIEGELSKHGSLDPFVLTLKSERAFGIASFGTFPNLPVIGWVAGELENYVKYMNQQIAIGGEWPSQQATTETVKTSGMTDLLVPAVKSAREANLRSIAQTRCVRVFNAIQSQPADAKSPSIDSLGLPAEAIIDPFSGDPLIMQNSDAGWTVYSVGPNGTDDGGQVTSEESVPLDIGI